MMRNKVPFTIFFFSLFIPFAMAYEEQYVPVTPVKEVKIVEEDPEANVPNQGNIKQEEYVLDGRYRGGRNLIYDCDRDHYACIDDISKENCDFRRKKQEMHKKNNLSCAFFKTYPTKKECLIEQYKVMDKKLKTVFCFKKHQ